MLSQSRAFFSKRNVTEVDCPLITKGASIDAHIDLIPICFANKEKRYLHSSPEYGMKRLLSEGLGDIYQLAHVFRDGEISDKHNPEFMMAEWYRLNFSFLEMIDETIEYIRLFLGQVPFTILSYREAILKYAGFDYLSVDTDFLMNYLKQNHIEPYPGIEKEGIDALLNIVLGVVVEPHLGENELTVLSYYPASQAALAKTIDKQCEKVAERFEIYYQGLELCNGYHELTNAKEQRKRFLESNEFRLQLGKAKLPIDEAFLKALENGLPDCFGVAVGFDRLMMLRHKTKKIASVIAFDWSQA